MTHPSSRFLSAPGAVRSMIGDVELIALHDGTVVRERPAGFISNATENDFSGALSEAGLAPDALCTTFTTFALRVKDSVTLFDPGFGDSGPVTTGRLMSNLAAVGIAARDVSTVIISHFHGDHILGLKGKDSGWRFPNAEILVPQQEWDYWMDEGALSRAPSTAKSQFATARRVFDGVSGHRLRHFRWNDEVVPGVTAICAVGHTPGHTAFQIVDGSEHAIYAADITNNPYVFARHPGWHSQFDVDPQAAEDTRRTLLDRLAADHSRTMLFHAPFPAVGYFAKSAGSYEFIPQLVG